MARKPKSHKRQGMKIVKKGHHSKWTFPGKGIHEAQVLHSIYPGVSIEDYSEMVQDLIQLIESLVRNHGFTVGPQRYSEIKTFTISLMEGRNPENPGWLATSRKWRIPSKLGKKLTNLVISFLDSTDKNPSVYQAVLTLLSINRKVKGLSDPNLCSITDKAEPINEELLQEFETYVSKTLEPYKFKPNGFNLSRVNPSIRKKGPNNKPKVESAHMEAVALRDSNLWNPFKNLCSYLDLDYLVDYLDVLVGVPLEDPASAVKTQLRILVKIPDSGFKTRIVAISDFWTQLILEPVRAHIIATTEKLYGSYDYRMNQHKGVDQMVTLQKMCMEGKVIEGTKLEYSKLGFLDASSWTDRFHRDLQKITMKHLFSSSMAEAWAQLVVHCPWYYTPLGSIIKYGQGQGMGTNGSFDIATLTDHMFINFIIDKDEELSLLKKHNIPLYGKVGDDLFSYKYELFLDYYKKISLPINISKSKVPCELGSVAEFCSRTFINGKDVSRINPGIISKTKDFKYFPTLIGLCHSRGISIRASYFPSLSRKTKDGATYLDKLQPWLLSMYVLHEYDDNIFVQKYNIEQMVKEEWFVNDEYLHQIYDQKARARLLLSNSIITLANTHADLQDKIFDMVEGMEHYGDEILEHLGAEEDYFNLGSESVEYLLNNPFSGQNCPTPKQIVVLNRYRVHRTLIRERLDNLLATTPESPRDIHNRVREISKICHSSCYDGGSLSYDVAKTQSVLTSITKTLERLNSDFTTLTLPGTVSRNVYTYLDYDQIKTKFSDYLPQFISEDE